MNTINEKNHKELIEILTELIETIKLMKNSAYYFLDEDQTDKEELKSLENEISDRFFFKFDVQIGTSELDNKRAELMKKYIFKSNEYLK